MEPENTGGVLHERIVKARESAGFSITEAAGKLGFKNYQTLSSLEKGARNITANELIEMARLYGRSLDYFFESEVSTEPAPLWRKIEKTGDAKKEQREFLTFLERYSNLENLLGLKRRWTDIRSPYDHDDFAHDGFEVAARLGADVHKKLDLGSRPACNLLNVLENLRIKILHMPLSGGVSGASIVDDALGVGILVNISDVPWRRNYDLAHELFHVVTWNVFSAKEIGDGTKKTRPEKYADIFASSLLLPEGHLIEGLKDIAPDNTIKRVDIIDLAKDFEVSTEAILWRLVNLKKLKETQVKRILAEPDFRDLDRTMRRGLSEKYKPAKFPARYAYLACRCLMEGKISRGTFAEYLEIERSEVDDRLAEMGFAEESYEKIAVA